MFRFWSIPWLFLHDEWIGQDRVRCGEVGEDIWKMTGWCPADVGHPPLRPGHDRIPGASFRGITGKHDQQTRVSFFKLMSWRQPGHGVQNREHRGIVFWIVWLVFGDHHGSFFWRRRDEGGMEMGGFSGPWSGVKTAFFIFCTDFGSENSRSEPLKLIFSHPKSPWKVVEICTP